MTVNVNPIMQTMDINGMPVYPDYVPPEEQKRLTEYAVYVYADERPDVYGDDTDINDVTTIDLHIYSKCNPQKYKKAARRFLRSSGFIILNTAENYESDTGFYHIAVEAEIEGVVDDSEE